MKKYICCIIIFISIEAVAQLHSGTPVVQSKPQPVPNSTTSEKSAPPQPINIPPSANPVPPVYPGADVKVVEIPRQLINPPSTPSGTQPIQKEPLSPVESTNTLQPNRSQREESSRLNKPVAIPINTQVGAASNINNNYRLVQTKRVNYTSPLNTAKKSAPAKLTIHKKVKSKKSSVNYNRASSNKLYNCLAILS